MQIIPASSVNKAVCPYCKIAFTAQCSTLRKTLEFLFETLSTHIEKFHGGK